MALTMYALIEVTPFITQANPGDVPVYPQLAAIQVIKTIERVWENARNYYLLYINISRACFRMIDELVPSHCKVSNIPALLGWNPTMSIQTILEQLKTSYGKPNTTILFNNNKLFSTDFSPTPELLFHQIEQCQEVAILADTPYTSAQLVLNTTQLLLKSRIFPMHEFDD